MTIDTRGAGCGHLRLRARANIDLQVQLVAAQHTTRQIVQMGDSHTILTGKGAHNPLGHLLAAKAHPRAIITRGPLKSNG